MDTSARDAGRRDARRLAQPVGAIAGFVAIVGGLVFLADRNGARNLLGSIYELLGNSAAAQAARSGTADQLLAKLIMAGLAIAIGVAGVWLVFAGANALIERLGPRWRDRLIPWLFVGPVAVLVCLFLVYPAVSTIVTSLTEDGGAAKNYGFVFTDRTMVNAIGNNILWLVVGTAGSVLIGLLVAALFDRVHREALAKTFIFLPLAISLVGASVIWGFVYAWRPEGKVQYGLLNAAWTGLGFDPVAWVQTPPINNYALITIMIWLQSGFAMVVLSAAIKGVPVEVLEAARLDGASERQTFFRVVVPMIKGSIITVATTIAIAVLKVFDIVFVMTGGRFGTDVVANRMFNEAFQFFNDGRASALAVILFLAVVPIMLINVRNLRRQGVGA